MNGRSVDAIGEFTYMSTTGCSVVDYALVSADLLLNPNVSFEVRHTMLTKNNPILVCVQIAEYPERNLSIETQRTLPLLERISLVKKENMVEFARKFNVGFGNYIGVLEEALKPEDGERVLQILIGVIREIGKNYVRKNKRRQGPHWFNKECERLKLRGRRALSGFRKTRLAIPLTRYVKAKTAYRTAIKKAKKQYKLDSHEKMKTALKQGKPDEIWKLIKQQVRRKESAITTRIFPAQWIEHFNKTLNHRCPNNSEWTVDEDNLPEVEEGT